MNFKSISKSRYFRKDENIRDVSLLRINTVERERMEIRHEELFFVLIKLFFIKKSFKVQSPQPHTRLNSVG